MGKLFTLDGLKIKDRDELYYYLKEGIDSPEFHGNNLDALWDVLSYSQEEIIIMIINEADFQQNLGDYFTLLIGLFDDLKQTNKRFNYQILT